MPYIPPHLRPGYVSTYVPPPVKKGTRFPTNVDIQLTTNVKANNGTRHSPRRNAIPGKKTLKNVRKMTPNSEPVYKPSHTMKNWPAKFRNYATKQIGKSTMKKTRKIKKTKKTQRKCIRKGRKTKCVRRIKK